MGWGLAPISNPQSPLHLRLALLAVEAHGLGKVPGLERGRTGAQLPQDAAHAGVTLEVVK